MDIQIEENTFSIAADEDEPEQQVEFPLESAEGFYRTLRTYLEEHRTP